MKEYRFWLSGPISNPKATNQMLSGSQRLRHSDKLEFVHLKSNIVWECIIPTKNTTSATRNATICCLQKDPGLSQIHTNTEDIARKLALGRSMLGNSMRLVSTIMRQHSGFKTNIDYQQYQIATYLCAILSMQSINARFVN